MQIAIVGAGIMGMSAAYVIKEAFPQFHVVVYAEKLTPDNTSDGAAGLFSKTPVEKNPLEMTERWANATLDYVRKELISNPVHARNIGLSFVDGYLVSCEENVNPNHVKNLRSLEKSELSRFPKEVKSAYALRAGFLECRKYIPWITKEFLSKGGKIIKRKVDTLNSLSHYDIIINCSGLGARYLVNDKLVVPVRGQIVRVKAPWVTEFVRMINPPGEDRDFYILVNQDYIVLGGTKNKNDFDLTCRKKDTEWILSQTQRFIPSLQRAEIVDEWVGLRPSRPTIRLEKETMQLKSEFGDTRSVNVIHNYGHSGYGVSLFWGCTQEVLELVKSCVECKSNL